jgi:hypothetical protein
MRAMNVLIVHAHHEPTNFNAALLRTAVVALHTSLNNDTLIVLPSGNARPFFAERAWSTCCVSRRPSSV